MATLESGDKQYTTLLNEIETGQIKIPQFQRQFVWDISSSAKLIDSVLKGYPIGTFIYWRTNERLRSVKNIGNITLPEPKDGEFVNYVLDGQQRITSLFAALKGEKIERENGKKEDFSEIYIDLKATNDDPIVIVDITNKKKKQIIKLTDLMFEKGKVIYNKYKSKHHDKIDGYKAKITGFQFRGINLKEAEIDEATEVFTRLNVGGKDLSLFEIMVAKTFDPSRDFDLYEKFQELKQDLQPTKYDTISSATVLQLLSILVERECKRKTILLIDKKTFIDTWDETVSCLKSAIDFFRSYGIPVSRLLPYNALLVPFGYFFHHHKSNPTGLVKERLEDFFWRASLGLRYSSAVEGKFVQDIDKIDKIIKGELPKYEWSVDTSLEGIINNGFFSTSKSYVKAILCLYAMQKPKSFDNNLDVNIDNSWLKIGTSKNYHHYFPKSYMRKNHPEFDYFQVNHILNITIVDGYLNKNRIRAKAPSVYMSKFREENAVLSETMESHLINNLEKFGIWNDDFASFFKERAKLVSQELSKKIIQQTSLGKLEEYEEFVEEEITE
jgi:hypothetical protein